MHIVFCFPHGFAARMILRAGVAERLVSQGARVTIVSPNAEESYFQQECLEAGAAFFQEPKNIGRMANWFRSHRAYLLDDVMNNPALKAQHVGRFHGRPLQGFFMELVNRTAARSVVFQKSSRALERRLNRSEEIHELLSGLRPDLLVVFTPFGQNDTLYLLHAIELGIPVVCEMLSWDNITSKGTPLLMPDYFISWGPIMTQEMIKWYGFPPEKIFECGVPHFDVYRRTEKFTPRDALLREFNLNTGRPYIFYGMVARIFVPNEMEIVRWLVERINSNSFSKPCSLIIRPHPQMVSGYYSNGKDLDNLRSLTGPNVAVDVPPVLSDTLAWDLPKRDMYHLASLLAGCAMCINASSTLCLDACMLDRPVVNIGFDGSQDLPYEQSARRGLDYIHMTKLLSLGGVRLVRSFGELQNQINAYLEDPGLDREGRRLTVSQECGPADGRAAERVADTLLKLARRSSPQLGRYAVGRDVSFEEHGYQSKQLS
jgi:CDP-glycerol glycerophosphotransferase (TagB/SpsB family)